MTTSEFNQAVVTLKKLGNSFLNNNLKDFGYKVDIFEAEFNLDELCRNIHYNIPLEYSKFLCNGLDKRFKEFGQDGLILNVYDGSYTLSIVAYSNGKLVTGLNVHLDAYYPNDIEDEIDERNEYTFAYGD